MKTLAILLSVFTSSHAEPTPPVTKGTVSIPAQEWPLRPGPREITLHVRYVRVTKDMVDGKVFTTTGHALGNRTAIVGQVAGEVLKTLRRKGLTDFERKEDIRYATANGTWIISYAKGWPEGSFESK